VQVATTSAAPFPAPVAAAATFINSTSFSANWGSVSGATNYQLDVSTNINFSNFVTGFNNLSVPVISTTVTSLVPGTTYYYRVRAVKTGEISVNSSTITVATATVVPVAKAATNIGSSSLTANWNSVNGASGYRLDVSTTSTFSSFLPGYNNLTVTGTSYSITGIPEKTTIYYRVRAVNSTGIVSGNSNTIVAYNYDQNYIRTMAVNTPGKTTTSQLETATLEERSTSYTFYDGLGRGLQLVGSREPLDEGYCTAN
jgi:phosphodiesterase/alkaline phosphatase D-like protein